MDIQNKFSKFLKESAPIQTSNTKGFPGTPATMSIDDVVMGDIFNLQDPENLDRLNAYLEILSNQPVINPYFLLKRIQDKLSVIGLHFVVPRLMNNNGTIKVPLTQFGGTYGYEKYDPSSKESVPTKDIGLPKIGRGDGLDRLGHGLSVRISYTCVKGIYTLDVQIVNSPAVEEQPIHENRDLDEKHIGFDKLANKLSHEKGISDPKGLAAAIGNKKYGKEKMHKAAASGHELHENLLDETTPPGWSATVKAMKRHRNITNPFALSWFMKKHGAHAHYGTGTQGTKVPTGS